MLQTAELMCGFSGSRRLAKLLPDWLSRVPLYADAAYDPARSGDCSPAEWAVLPQITKKDIRHGFPANFLGPHADLDALLESEQVELEYTSGTSEERTPLLLPQGWWNEQEARALQLNAHVAGVLRQSPEARRVTINSPMCSNDISYTGVPSQCERTVGNALFVSLSRLPFVWGQYDLERMAREMMEWDPEFLDVDPVFGVRLALHCERQGVRLPRLKFILASYEFASAHHKRILERVFQVPVYNLYGSTETGHLLMENERGEFKPSRETALLEIVETDDRGIGHLVVTTLSNPYMPLVRYRIGDLVEVDRTPGGCVRHVHGRAADAFLARGKRVTVGDVDAAMAEVPGVAHYQLLQQTDGNWVARLYPDNDGLTAGALSDARERLQALVGVAVAVQPVDLLLPEKSGKFRLVYPQRRPG